ncbi:MAG: o-succinylbenzoate synthase [Thermoprotei archaeon]
MKPKLSCFEVLMPFKVPFTTSFGTQSERHALLFRLEMDGVEAYSECVTDDGPYYSYEDNLTALHIIRDYLARLIEDLPEPTVFLERSKVVKGHNMAKAALEMLLWDYYSKLSGKPLHEYLGESKGYADVGISIGMDSVEKVVTRVGEALQRGYRRVKVKIERGREHEILGAIREVYPEIPLTADANCDYRIKDIEILKSLDKYNLVYLEQPLDHDDLIDHAKLRKQMSTPICLDESITSPEKARKAFEIGAADVINIKPGRVSGITSSLEIARIARGHGGHVWVGGMLETGIGRAFNVALASHTLVDYPGDTSPNDKYFERDIVKNPFKMVEGRIRPNTSPGIGVQVDLNHLLAVCVKMHRIM